MAAPSSPATSRLRLSPRGLLILQLAYVAAGGLIYVARGAFPSLDFFLLLLGTALLWRRQDRPFLVAFLPFVLLLLGYDALRAYADDLSPTAVQVDLPIRWERALFGGRLLPVLLQQALLNRPFRAVLDPLANGLYLSHFLAPVLLALLIWKLRPRAYLPFMLGLTGLSYAAFLTFLLLPVAPPWWATLQGTLTGTDRVTLAPFFVDEQIMLASPNPVAALPSLHAAYPLYLALWGTSLWGRRAWPLWLLTGGVALAVIYLGHHYGVDVLAGWAYALVAFALVRFPWRRRPV